MGSFFAFGGLWAGPYLMHVYGMSRTQAGAILNMLAVGIAVGSPLMGYLSEHVFRSRKKILVFSATVFVAILAILNLYPSGLPHGVLYLIFFLFAACSVAPGVVSVATAKELFPLGMTGTSVGTVNLFPFLGGAVMQLVVGWILDSFPSNPSGAYSLEAYSAMLRLFLILSLVGLVATFLVKETFGNAFSSEKPHKP